MGVSPNHAEQLNRAQGALIGLALGDALGMPSQTLSRALIQAHYGQISDFVAPYDDHPVSHGLRAAQVTDDTEQAILLAERLLSNPRSFDASGWAKDLLAWEVDVQRRGLRDLLGPSTKAALSAIEAGVEPGLAARGGTTNGAAMRVCPVGIACSLDDMGQFVDTVEMTCRVTHNTGEAIAAAAAVAAAISVQIDGADLDRAMDVALDAASMGQTRGYQTGDPDMRGRILQALEYATAEITNDELADAIGNSVASYESVAAAFAIARRANGNVWNAALIAANFGDDTDTIGAIGCAICGAGSGMTGIPADKHAALLAANDIEIDALAERLVAMRRVGLDAQKLEVSF